MSSQKHNLPKESLKLEMREGIPDEQSTPYTEKAHPTITKLSAHLEVAVKNTIEAAFTLPKYSS